MPQRNWLITGVSSGFGRIMTEQLLSEAIREWGRGVDCRRHWSANIMGLRRGRPTRASIPVRRITSALTRSANWDSSATRAFRFGPVLTVSALDVASVGGFLRGPLS
jgi:hypothetical protein